MISDDKHQNNDRTESGPPPSEADGRAMRRRRFVGAAGGLGVLLAVQARTALGQSTCESLSGQLSGNTSPHSDHQVPCTLGRSPGFWSQPQHFSEWVGAEPPTISAEMTSLSLEGQGQLKKIVASSDFSPGTPINAIFPGAALEPMNGEPSVGVWQSIAVGDLGEALGTQQLLRYLACAWLNANAITGYPLSPGQVQEMWMQLSTTGQYCPTPLNCTTGLTAEEVERYLESTFT